MKALAPIDVLDFDDLLWVTSDRFDRMDAVPAVANERTLDRSRHVSFSIQGRDPLSDGPRPPRANARIRVRFVETKVPSQVECCSMTGTVRPGGPVHPVAHPRRCPETGGSPLCAAEGQLHRVAVVHDEPACGLERPRKPPLELVVVPNPRSFCGVAEPSPWHRFVLGVLVERR